MKLFQSLLIGATAISAIDTYSAKVLVDTKTSNCELIESVHVAQLHRAIQTTSDVVEITTRRENLPHSDEILSAGNEQEFIEIFGGSTDAVLGQVAKRCPLGALKRNTENSAVTATPVIRKVVYSGEPKNRIDIVFMGDGYTATEDKRFFDDMHRLTTDMFTGETFTQYLPLFNVWAVHVPSVESGIGVGGKPRDTAFGLYRDGTELRGIYYTKPQYARDVCKSVGEFACDFPSLIGNDDFYGGLGGEFVISTRSPTTGTIVLRHEMGHNFGKVGEEYDGGQVYNGANSVPTLNGVTWKHWLTNPNVIREEKSAQRYQKHIWYDLKQGAYQIKFTSDGNFKRWYILLSISGADTNDSLTVTLDGKPLPWKTAGVKDRTFYNWKNSDAGFTAGEHVLEIKAGGSFDSPIIKQLCNAVVYEYAGEDEFKQNDNDYIGLYPTYDINKRLSYRPNNERCLMRNMTSPKFCSVCLENMWQQFMSRITFIDNVLVNGKNVEVKLIPLGQLRPSSDPFVLAQPETASKEKYSVQWFNNGQEVVAFRDKFKIDVSAASGASKEWTVKVQFDTPSVRLDSKNVMHSERNFTVDGSFC